MIVTLVILAAIGLVLFDGCDPSPRSAR